MKPWKFIFGKQKQEEETVNEVEGSDGVERGPLSGVLKLEKIRTPPFSASRLPRRKSGPGWLSLGTPSL